MPLLQKTFCPLNELMDLLTKLALPKNIVFRKSHASVKAKLCIAVYADGFDGSELDADQHLEEELLYDIGLTEVTDCTDGWKEDVQEYVKSNMAVDDFISNKYGRDFLREIPVVLSAPLGSIKPPASYTASDLIEVVEEEPELVVVTGQNPDGSFNIAPASPPKVTSLLAPGDNHFQTDV